MVERISAGIAGLDSILGGGFFKERAYMVSGGPGCGKTTLCLQFLAQCSDEPTLYITFDKSMEKIRWMAESLGLMPEKLVFEDLSPGDIEQEAQDAFDVIPSSDLGLAPILRKICDALDRHRPARVVIEPLSSLAALSPDAYQFRRQSQALFNFIASRGATLLFSSEATDGEHSTQGGSELNFIADGIVTLARMGQGRSIRVSKHRGSTFSAGNHFMKLTSSGMRVYPRMVPSDHSQAVTSRQITTDIPALNDMLNGGMHTGSMIIIAGPTGVGKTTLGMQFVCAAAKRGERALVFCFEESEQTVLSRCERLHLPAAQLTEAGDLQVQTIEPMRFSPDELAQSIRQQIEEHDIRTVMIDGSSGYKVSVENLAVDGEDVNNRLHALCRYLVSAGVSTILVNETPHISSENVSAADPSMNYLSDTLIMLRYIEVKSELRKTIGVIKNRVGDFAKTLHRFDITDEGLQVGPPLHGLSGILRGQPIQIDPDTGS
ncbi:ATPase domain-containing protein [Marinobacter salicampi]|uniref:ATPase domain-containing protein n=1 Tax=Marinobacter salicampi TaxID=435907 RepID=UPI001408EB17|nr:ATPase domain-containing protein [Marinobacter salicampi]